MQEYKPINLTYYNPCTSMKAKSIEELYINFKIFVDGFCIQERYYCERFDE